MDSRSHSAGLYLTGSHTAGLSAVLQDTDEQLRARNAHQLTHQLDCNSDLDFLVMGLPRHLIGCLPNSCYPLTWGQIHLPSPFNQLPLIGLIPLKVKKLRIVKKKHPGRGESRESQGALRK